MPTHVIVPLIVACALFMQNLDSTSLATSLPAIAESFGEPALRLHMAITAYMLALAAFLPMSGWVADRYGARNIFRLAIFVFTMSSISCGLAANFDQLIAARICQGIGGAMMVPVGRLILVRSVPKSELVAAMALMGVPSLVGPIIGPLLGGVITTYSNWRWIFWINVPVGILGFILVSKFIENIREENVKPFDWIGFGLSAFGLAATVFGMDTAFTKDRPDAIGLGLLFSGIVALAIYVPYSRRVSNPIMDLSLMRIRTFRASVTGGSTFRIGVGAMPFLLPLLMQEGFGYSPAQSGVITFVSAAGSLGMRTVARRILRAYGFKRVLIWNAFIASAFMAACASFRADTPQVVMMAIIFFGGVFRSLEFTSLNAIAFADVERAEMSHAMSFSQMAQRLSLTIGVAMSALILHRVAGDVSPIPVRAFEWAFLIIGIVSATSVFSFFSLAPDAGAVLSGRKIERPEPR
ncbi:MAG: family efflux transporter permease subunit [Hyphomicrobiales bacterium]|nr:family efflux transporter permease subunit [Hyphomicrobiales bacterium]